MNVYLTDGIAIATGLIFSVFAAYYLLTIKKIAKSGIEVEGIIFDFESSTHQSVRTNNLVTVYQIVRFVTDLLRKTTLWIVRF